MKIDVNKRNEVLQIISGLNSGNIDDSCKLVLSTAIKNKLNIYNTKVSLMDTVNKIIIFNQDILASDVKTQRQWELVDRHINKENTDNYVYMLVESKTINYIDNSNGKPIDINTMSTEEFNSAIKYKLVSEEVVGRKLKELKVYDYRFTEKNSCYNNEYKDVLSSIDTFDLVKAVAFSFNLNVHKASCNDDIQFKKELNILKVDYINKGSIVQIINAVKDVISTIYKDELSIDCINKINDTIYNIVTNNKNNSSGVEISNEDAIICDAIMHSILINCDKYKYEDIESIDKKENIIKIVDIMEVCLAMQKIGIN